MSDPTDSYHAHQKQRQVYVVLRVDEGASPLASRFTVVKILRRYDEAEREVSRLNASGSGAHVWQVGWLAPDDGPAEAPRERDELERLRAERDSLRVELERARRGHRSP